MATEMVHLLCVGMGYTAQALAGKLSSQEWAISGTARTADGIQTLKNMGYHALRFDGVSPLTDPKARLRDVTHLLISAPPGEEGDPWLQHHRQTMLRLTSLRWVGYLSSTGVYGDHSGAWVDESTRPKPTNPRAQRRLHAEQTWWRHWLVDKLPVHIFRLAGIYGPGRNAIEQLRSQRARLIHKPGQVFSRIHVDDIVQTLRRSMKAPSPGTLYNVSDDLPAPASAVMRFASQLLGVTPPPSLALNDPRVGDMARSFYRDNKRVANRRIKDDLGVTLTYANYRIGLRALM
ncbi:MAG: SDR family oxidoreductase [Myxococcota bacterium]